MIKKALCFLGDYSDTWKKNIRFNPDADIFMCSYGYREEMKQAQEYFITDDFSDIINVHEMQKPAHIIDQFRKHCEKMMAGKGYDICIYTTFMTVIPETIQHPGTYHALPFCNMNNISTYFEMISDMCVRFGNPNEHTLIQDLDIPTRKMIFEALYGNRVMDFVNIPTNNTSDIIFLTPSVVHVTNNPFNYNTFGKRSVFTHNDRFNQTLSQVESLHQITNPYKCFILEGSNLTFSEMDALSRHSTVVLFGKDERGQYHANENPNKSMYELYVIREMLDRISCNWVFKFGGRYRLMPKFNIKKFLTDKMTMKIIPTQQTYCNKALAECIIYSIPCTLFDKYKKIYSEMMRRVESEPEVAIEEMFYHYSAGFKLINFCGIIGRDAVYGFDKIL